MNKAIVFVVFCLFIWLGLMALFLGCATRPSFEQRQARCLKIMEEQEMAPPIHGEIDQADMGWFTGFVSGYLRGCMEGQ